MFEIPDKKLSILISADKIAARVKELGAEITREYRGKEVVVVGVLKGSFIFMADLVRHIELPITLEFMGIASYGDETKSSGVVRITSDLTKPIDGKHLIIVEDIIDTGLTIDYLLDNLTTRHPASVKICALLHKPERAVKQVPIDYLGFNIANQFVVGYGLDFAQKYRNLPFIGLVEGASE
ncbi:MAG: hypoxanthine phosphoribosyltransferase [Deltaproteobacteria bacterium]|nr:hypoxanthine phosphoribosyltransferase [Deltaproteobacteria bacterium]